MLVVALIFEGCAAGYVCDRYLAAVDFLSLVCWGLFLLFLSASNIPRAIPTDVLIVATSQVFNDSFMSYAIYRSSLL